MNEHDRQSVAPEALSQDAPPDESLELVRPSVRYRPSFIEMIDEWKAAGEDRYGEFRQLARTDFTAVVKKLENSAAGRDLPPGRVASQTYWLVRDDEILGCLRLRPRLNEVLIYEGGNIGYDVRPSHRGRGYATVMLRLALNEARAAGLKRVLLTCSKDNVASARVILRNGGVLESEVRSQRHEGMIVQRYWIEL